MYPTNIPRPENNLGEPAKTKLKSKQTRTRGKSKTPAGWKLSNEDQARVDLLERRKKSFAELYGPSGVSGVPAATRASVLRVRSVPADPSDAEIEAAYAKLEELVDRRNAARELKPQVVLVVGAVPDLA